MTIRGLKTHPYNSIHRPSGGRALPTDNCLTCGRECARRLMDGAEKAKNAQPLRFECGWLGPSIFRQWLPPSCQGVRGDRPLIHSHDAPRTLHRRIGTPAPDRTGAPFRTGFLPHDGSLREGSPDSSQLRPVAADGGKGAPAPPSRHGRSLHRDRRAFRAQRHFHPPEPGHPGGTGTDGGGDPRALGRQILPAGAR